MAGASRSSSSHQRPSPMVQPPRPPNAWILYRSDKLREMMQLQLNAGGPKKAQADVSKEVAALWKVEAPGIRAEYERLAEIRKAEHAALYPNYKFKPKKKEEKARLREQKRAEKERLKEEAKRNKARHMAYTQPYIPIVHTPYGVSDGRYDPAGPSPPMSAASTPSSSPSPPSSTEFPEYSLVSYATPATAPSPHSTPNPPPSTSPAPSQDHSELMSSLSPPESAASLSPHYLEVPSHNDWTLHSSPTSQSSPQVGSTSNDASFEAPSFDASSNEWNFGGQQMDAQQNNFGVDMQLTQNFLNFEIPSMDGLDFSMDNMVNGSDMSLVASSSSGIWQLSGLSVDSFLSNPPCEIDLSLGRVPEVVVQDPDTLQQEQFAQFLREFDFSQLPNVPNLFAGTTMEPTPSQDNFLGMADDQDRPRSVTHDSFMQFLNLDSSVSGTQQVQQSEHVATINPQAMSMAANSASTGAGRYVPPSGAANSAIRRVAGSWKPAPEVNESFPEPSVEHSERFGWTH